MDSFYGYAHLNNLGYHVKSDQKIYFVGAK